jgi:hypothetical protein
VAGNFISSFTLCVLRNVSQTSFAIGWAMVLVYGLSGHFGSIPPSMSMAIPMLFKRLMIALWPAMGLFTAFQTWLYRRFFPETPLTLHHFGLFLNGQKLGYLQVSLAFCRLCFH